MTGLADLYHRYLTGLVLALIVERGEDAAAEALFAVGVSGVTLCTRS